MEETGFTCSQLVWLHFWTGFRFWFVWNFNLYYPVLLWRLNLMSLVFTSLLPFVFSSVWLSSVLCCCCLVFPFMCLGLACFVAWVIIVDSCFKACNPVCEIKYYFLHSLPVNNHNLLIVWKEASCRNILLLGANSRLKLPLSSFLRILWMIQSLVKFT